MRIEIRGKEQLTRTAAALATKGNGKAMKRRLSKAIRKEAEPITRQQRRNLAARMPHRGGLAEVLSTAGTFTTRTTYTGKGAGVTITDSWRGHDMKAVEAGAIRHPVWGRWRRGTPTQRVPAGLLSGPVEGRKRNIQIGILRAMDALAEEIARES